MKNKIFKNQGIGAAALFLIGLVSGFYLGGSSSIPDRVISLLMAVMMAIFAASLWKVHSGQPDKLRDIVSKSGIFGRNNTSYSKRILETKRFNSDVTNVLVDIEIDLGENLGVFAGNSNLTTVNYLNISNLINQAVKDKASKLNVNISDETRTITSTVDEILLEEGALESGTFQLSKEELDNGKIIEIKHNNADNFNSSSLFILIHSGVESEDIIKKKANLSEFITSRNAAYRRNHAMRAERINKGI